MLASAQTTNGQTYGLSYAYNLAHGMTQMTYPKGRTVSWNYDAGNRVAGVGGTAPGGSASQSYAFGITYAPRGPVSELTLGNVSGRTHPLQFSPLTWFTVLGGWTGAPRRTRSGVREYGRVRAGGGEVRNGLRRGGQEGLGSVPMAMTK